MFKYPRDDKNKKRNFNYQDIFTFVHDRIRFCLKELTYLEEFLGDFKETVKMLEIIVRFYVISYNESEYKEEVRHMLVESIMILNNF